MLRDASQTLRFKQVGESLVSLMIGLAVGMIVVAGVIAAYTTTLKGGRDTLRADRLNQELRATLDVMANNLRRSGYWSLATTTGSPTTNPFAGITINTAKNCIAVNYDFDGSGTPTNASNAFGYKLASSTVMMWNVAGPVDCTATTGWESLTDPKDVTITGLIFETGHVSTGVNSVSQCVATGGGLPAPVLWSSASGAYTPACGDTSSSTAAALAAGFAAAGVAVGSTGTTYVLTEARTITITLTANNASDSFQKLTLTQPVLVRNNRVFTYTVP
jgi:type IV pilus assembly protein PilW